MRPSHPDRTGQTGKRAADLIGRMRLVEHGQHMTNRDVLRGFIGPLLVDEPVNFMPAGAAILGHSEKLWIWLERDIDPALGRNARQHLAPDAHPDAISAFCSAVSATIYEQIKLQEGDPDAARRARVQIDDQDAFDGLEKLAMAFRCQPFLAKAGAFGRGLNTQREDSAIALSLKSFPAKQSQLFPYLMHAALAQVSNPSRVVNVVVQLAGGSSEAALDRSGYAPIMDAMLAHAQNQLSLIYDKGPFADMDLACRAVARFHALVRGVSIVTEDDPHSRWAVQTGKLIAHISDQLEPRIQRIEADVRQSLRPARSETDGADTDLLLDALNGMYLLSTVREARESLGVNSALETAWNQTGQVLEILISRNLEAFKQDPHNEFIARKLDTAINMARIRFNPEYADIIRKAMEGASRRKSPA